MLSFDASLNAKGLELRREKPHILQINGASCATLPVRIAT